MTFRTLARPVTLLCLMVVLSVLVACTGSTTGSESTIVATVVATPPSGVTIVSEDVGCSTLNLNEATDEQFLATIPDLPTRMVREFEEYRPYISIQQFRQEIGKYVDDATITRYEQYVFVPINPNSSDSATLQQLPGVTEAIATQLIAARPFASTDAFLSQLGSLATSSNVAQAPCYLEAGL